MEKLTIALSQSAHENLQNCKAKLHPFMNMLAKVPIALRALHGMHT